MVAEFEQAAFEGELNAVIGPVKTQFGYHLIKVYDRKEAVLKPFEQVEGQVKSALVHKKQQEIYDAKIDELKEKYITE